MQYPLSDGIHESKLSDDLLDELVDRDMRNYFQVMPEDWIKFSVKFKQNLAKYYWKRMLNDA
tara:strand:- start:698 stop:883 length:186 start_codon:yes stop_codon:yes gene_type:complete